MGVETRFYLEASPELEQALEHATPTLGIYPLVAVIDGIHAVRYSPIDDWYYKIDELCDGLPHFVEVRNYHSVQIWDTDKGLIVTGNTLDEARHLYITELAPA